MLSCQCLVSFRWVIWAFSLRGLFAVQHVEALRRTEGHGGAATPRYNTPSSHGVQPVNGKGHPEPPRSQPMAEHETTTGSAILKVLAQVFTFAVAALLLTGFVIRKQDIFVPSEGWGYVLGIVGGISMLLLLFYPMVKRIPSLGFRDHSVFWLRAHMVLGTVGPLLIFYHSNFSLGATNSNIALFCMILVAVSGVAGRYVYTRVHRGLSAVRFDLNTLLAGSSRLLAMIGEDTGGNNALVARQMADFASVAMPAKRSVVTSITTAIMLPLRASFARSNMMHEVRQTISRNAELQGWSKAEKKERLRHARQHVNEFLYYATRASQLKFWEHMFSLWHILHVPLFFILLVSGVIHVVAVHLY